MPFQRLHPAIRKVLASKGIDLPTKAQELAIPEIMKGRNVLLIAPTGIGKTESAVLPIFNNFLLHREIVEGYEKRGISILYVTPLRALNRDMLRRLSDWGAALGIDVAVRHGDTSKKERARQSGDPPDMLITTPETLQVLFAGARLRRHIAHVRWLVIDEVHELAQDERGAQLSVALERLSQVCRKNGFNGHDFQRVGLSATVGSPKKVAHYLVGEGREVNIINIASMKEFDIRVVSPGRTEADEALSAELEWDAEAIAALRWCKTAIDSHRSTLLFVNTRDHAEAITSRYGLWLPGFRVGVHHGSLARDVRIEMEDEFKSGELKALICTSSLELGIDVGNTDLVIQYNSPRKVERLIQRVGRSGHRAGEISRGVVMTTSPDDIAEAMVLARRALAGELEPVLTRMKPLDVLANQLNAWPFLERENSIEEVYDGVTRAYAFRNLEYDEFNRVLDLLASIRTVWVDREGRRKKEEKEEEGEKEEKEEEGEKEEKEEEGEKEEKEEERRRRKGRERRRRKGRERRRRKGRNERGKSKRRLRRNRRWSGNTKGGTTGGTAKGATVGAAERPDGCGTPPANRGILREGRCRHQVFLFESVNDTRRAKVRAAGYGGGPKGGPAGRNVCGVAAIGYGEGTETEVHRGRRSR